MGCLLGSRVGVLGVAVGFWTMTTLSALTGVSLSDGMTTIALQQGGVGLLLTVLIVTTPPMAAQFFNGSILIRPREV